jgi:hypothetical protein
VAKQRDRGFPTVDAIVAFIRANPGKVGTSEIAREFGLKNADRAELKRILRELADKGTIKKRGKEISGRKSASMFRGGHRPARRRVSAIARCCASRSSKSATAKALFIAGVSSKSSITPRRACSAFSARWRAAADA